MPRVNPDQPPICFSSSATAVSSWLSLPVYVSPIGRLTNTSTCRGTSSIVSPALFVIRERGIPTYGVSPFILWGEVLRGIHGPDERIPLRAFERGVLRMRRIVETFAYDLESE